MVLGGRRASMKDSNQEKMVKIFNAFTGKVEEVEKSAKPMRNGKRFSLRSNTALPGLKELKRLSPGNARFRQKVKPGFISVSVAVPIYSATIRSLNRVRDGRVFGSRYLP